MVRASGTTGTVGLVSGQRDFAMQTLEQLLHDAVRHHCLATAVVDSVFVSRIRTS